MKGKMEHERNQELLRQRFWFRLIVLILSIAGSILYGFFNACSPAFWGVVLGLSGSALVWSFVELMDFFVETYHRFTNERCQFFIMVEDYWSQLRNVFRKETDMKDIPWEKVADIINNLYSDTARFPFHGGIYSISKEFETAVAYITRLYWKSHGYIHSKERKNTQDYWEPFYQTFVSIKSELAKEPIKTFAEFVRINDQINDLRDIKVSFQDFDDPEEILDDKDIGDLGERIAIPSGELEYKTFIPMYDFHQKFHQEPPYGVFRTVMGLLFRRIEKR